MRFLDETLWALTNSIYVEGKLRFWRDPTSYILKASSVTSTEPQKNLNSPQIYPKMPRNGPKMAKNDRKWPKVAQIWPNMAQEWPKMAQKLPKMAQNYPKWPKNYAPNHALFPQFFLTEKAVPQTFSLLECNIVLIIIWLARPSAAFDLYSRCP